MRLVAHRYKSSVTISTTIPHGAFGESLAMFGQSMKSWLP
jgi:hypothetical protein